jgi:hypothetical protein
VSKLKAIIDSAKRAGIDKSQPPPQMPDEAARQGIRGITVRLTVSISSARPRSAQARALRRMVVACTLPRERKRRRVIGMRSKAEWLQPATG